MATTGYYNPYTGKSQDEILGAWGRATGGNTVVTSENDWTNPQHAMYGGGTDAYGNMLDTLGKKFLGELGVDIADKQARRTFVQNALNLRNYATADAATSGNVSGDGSVKSAMSKYGDGFFQGGNMPTNPYQNSQATIQQNIANAQAAGTYKPGDAYYEFINNNKTKSAIESVAAAQLAGPYRDMLLDKFNDADIAGRGADPYTGYWGTLKNYAPFAAYVPPGATPGGSDTSGGSQGAPIGSAGPTPVVGSTPEGPYNEPTGPRDIPGAPGGVATRPGVTVPPAATIQPVGTGVELNPGAQTPFTPPFDRNAAQPVVSNALRQALARDGDPAQLKYWMDKAEAWGLDETLRRIQNNSQTKARDFYADNGGPMVAPRIQGSNDVEGIQTYFDWLREAGQERPENWPNFLTTMQNFYRQAGM